MPLMRFLRRSTALTLLALALCALSLAGTAKKYIFYVGTYTDHGSKGIYSYRFDSATGKSTSLGLAAESANPSFLAIASSGKFPLRHQRDFEIQRPADRVGERFRHPDEHRKAYVVESSSVAR